MLRQLSRRIAPTFSRQCHYTHPPLTHFYVRAHRSVVSQNGQVTSMATAKFHSTARRDVLPLFPLIASVLKASTALELTRTASRITMTFIPLILMKNYKSRMGIKHAALHGLPSSEEKINTLLKRIRSRTLLVNFLFLVPFTLFWATIIASLERTPLTGRWRMIILSPEEEEDIETQLKGDGWYRAVGDILSQEGSSSYIPPSDWRYVWVSETLRKLEATIPLLSQITEAPTDWTEPRPNGGPMPPPIQYPLTPRPRASEFLHRMCETVTDMSRGKQQHRKSLVSSSFEGPPYSLLLVDSPDTPNAFSYGFGPDGSGGIVVYSGFLDEIFLKYPIQYEQPQVDQNQSWWSQIARKLFFPSPLPPPKPKPTPEQTTELAILLSHELAHLILSHHLETLSSATIVVPGILSIASDVIRILIFPMTMLFGPFVNDAVAQLGKVGSGELLKIGEHCTSWKQEIEADVVSVRLLAHAGFDAREAVKFWEDRSQVECSVSRDSQGRIIMGIRGDSHHPLNETRIAKIKEELERWEKSRLATLKALETS